VRCTFSSLIVTISPILNTSSSLFLTLLLTFFLLRGLQQKTVVFSASRSVYAEKNKAVAGANVVWVCGGLRPNGKEKEGSTTNKAKQEEGEELEELRPHTPNSAHNTF